MLQQSYSRLLILMNWNQNLDKAGTPTLTATLFTAVRCRRDLYIHRWKNGWRKRGVYVCTMRYCSVREGLSYAKGRKTLKTVVRCEISCNSWGRKESDTTERLNWTEASQRWTNTTWVFLYEVSKGVKLLRAESRGVVARGRGQPGEPWRCWSEAKLMFHFCMMRAFWRSAVVHINVQLTMLCCTCKNWRR